MNRGYAKGGRAGFKHGSAGVEHGKQVEIPKDKQTEPSGRASRILRGALKTLKSHVARKEAKKVQARKDEIRKSDMGYATGGRIGFKKGTDKRWIQKATASIKKRGTKGKCTPITKKGCTGRAKALAKTFKKMAAKRKA